MASIKKSDPKKITLMAINEACNILGVSPFLNVSANNVARRKNTVTSAAHRFISNLFLLSLLPVTENQALLFFLLTINKDL